MIIIEKRKKMLKDEIIEYRKCISEVDILFLLSNIGTRKQLKPNNLLNLFEAANLSSESFSVSAFSGYQNIFVSS